MDMPLLTAAIVHDVKNQLAELHWRLQARGDAADEVAIVARSAQRLTRLLLLQREQSGQLFANSDAAYPCDLLNELAGEFSALFPQLQIKVDSAEAPELAFFDVFLVRLALTNAIHNACRYAQKNIVLRCYSRDENLVFEVRDDGPGFPAELLAAQSDSPKPPSERGTGLGLYLSVSIARLHHVHGRHGEVVLENKNGAVIRMRLP